MIASTLMIGFSHIVLAERLSRAQCRSRSGVTPSKARAPSNTLDPSQNAWLRGPRTGVLPSNHSPSRNVCVSDQTDIGGVAPRRKRRNRDIGRLRAAIKANFREGGEVAAGLAGTGIRDPGDGRRRSRRPRRGRRNPDGQPEVLEPRGSETPAAEGGPLSASDESELGIIRADDRRGIAADRVDHVGDDIAEVHVHRQLVIVEARQT